MSSYRYVLQYSSDALRAYEYLRVRVVARRLVKSGFRVLSYRWGLPRDGGSSPPFLCLCSILSFSSGFRSPEICTVTVQRINRDIYASGEVYSRTASVPRLFDIADMPANFSDLSDREVEVVAGALKGTTSLALFSRVSKRCRSVAVRVAEGEAPLSRLKARDVVCSAELVKWAIDQGLTPRRPYRREYGGSICAFAAGDGHLETLQWLRASGFEWDVDVCFSAAKGGHLDVLKWLQYRATAALGTKRHVTLQPREATWTSLSG